MKWNCSTSEGDLQQLRDQLTIDNWMKNISTMNKIS